MNIYIDILILNTNKPFKNTHPVNFFIDTNAFC